MQNADTEITAYRVYFEQKVNTSFLYGNQLNSHEYDFHFVLLSSASMTLETSTCCFDAWFPDHTKKIHVSSPVKTLRT